ncbi:hypothetical protein CC85DRAFT_286095 [Cutaneotrichosporon oleaginosum]|uniref:Uncharacterized protein n=1 Tax=Cutaneotrichosporon oleaginosum TaxID=879819 RepID=A0A0J0XL37_9TREE|nr:uncharacterized protein CC85DRAFT_286095 [Cutaneotrichosporon oleaginosum]KLT41858.1 hypothetical protein CC85DRAFT_286095 [Cutaneotrichosporon oleaginosum]TXT14776.1 hypothetical protein COLE_00969 [Cutaneotrichosporon oleaginosum]
MRAAVLALLPVAMAFTPIVIDIEFDTLAIPDFEPAVATPATPLTPFPASSSPALREEDELQIDWTGEGDTFDPVAYLDAQDALPSHTRQRAYTHPAGRLAPDGTLSAAAGAVIDIL